jgi:hypothetical protein
MALAVERPLAISMWDFSWLERPWPGAGYEDWDRALDELAEPGYDAVRIDAYPHLVATHPEREWTLLPGWDQHDWGAPARARVRVLPALPLLRPALGALGVWTFLNSYNSFLWPLVVLTSLIEGLTVGPVKG